MIVKLALTRIVFLLPLTVSVLWFFLMGTWVGLQCVIIVFPDHTHSLFAPLTLHSVFYLVSVARQAGLSLTWTETSKTGFLAMKAIFSAN